MLRASKSRHSSAIWPIGRRRIVMPFSANSIAISDRTKVRHEKATDWSELCESLPYRPDSGWDLSCLGAESPLSSASPKTLLHTRCFDHRACPLRRPRHVESDLLQSESLVENELVLARFCL